MLEYEHKQNNRLPAVLPQNERFKNMSTPAYNVAVVKHADRVMLVLAVLASGLLIFAGANANSGANAAPTATPTFSVGTAHSITHEGAPGGSLGAEVAPDHSHSNITTSGGTLGE